MAKWVWDNYSWVPYDPTNPKHQGRPTSDWGFQRDPQDGSIPFYANDVSATLMQQAFPGAISSMAFGSMFLEPERQRAIQEILRGQTQQGANQTANDFQKSLNQQAMGNARQTSASLYGLRGGGRQFEASNLLAQMNRANEKGAEFRAMTTDPRKLAMDRYGTLMQGFQSPMLNNTAQFIPGLEQQRQNGSFFGNLLNTGLQLWGSGAFNKPRYSGGGSGGGDWNSGNMFTGWRGWR